ncbi:MAG: ATP-binding cassette domain-containing protein, partial [Rhodobacteraceae bacterium]|nr:ATP-binding cassette domain-containing protein [Paracoccaceae bacterium]
MANSTGMNAISKESKEGNAVQLCNVVKSFGSTKALSGLNLELKQGEIHALLGPNGAGKTTAIGIMTGIRKSDAGPLSMLV